MYVTCPVCGERVGGRERGSGVWYPGQHKNYAGVRCPGENRVAEHTSPGACYCRQPRREEERR